MKFKFVLTAFVLLVFFSFSASALAMTDSEKQDLIAKIQQQIAQLMVQLQSLQGSQSQNPPPFQCHTFSLYLKLATEGAEISALQQALINDGETISDYNSSNDGIFTQGTAAAVTNFQKKYSISPLSGTVGPKTRAKLNQLFGCPEAVSLPEPSATPANIDNQNSQPSQDSTAENSVTCTSFAYSAWSQCNLSGTQTRTITNMYPSADCVGGNPVISEPCVYVANPAIKIISPNGGETWNVGEIQNIQWTATGFPANASFYVKLKNDSVSDPMQISNNIADRQAVLMATVPDYVGTYSQNTGAYSWKIPLTLEGASIVSKKLKISVSYVTNESVNAVSDNYFSISSPGVCNPDYINCTGWGICANGIQVDNCTDANNCKKALNPIVSIVKPCTVTVTGGNCGNGVCDSGESATNCPQDCHSQQPYCGDGICTPSLPENHTNCPQDCQCSASSDCLSGQVCSYNKCISDYCGDGICTAGKNYQNCPHDCGCVSNSDCLSGQICNSSAQCISQNHCGNGVCDSGENFGNCPQDCPLAAGSVCTQNSDCASGLICVNAGEMANNGKTCADSLCGNGVCDSADSSGYCPIDCITKSGNSCSTDSDCAQLLDANGNHEICFSGKCTAQLTCGGKTCVGNSSTTCPNSCTCNASSVGKKICVTTTVPASCISTLGNVFGTFSYVYSWQNAQCSAGQICLNGQCVSK